MVFISCQERSGSAYFEFQYCKNSGSVKHVLKRQKFWLDDSLLVSIDDRDRFMDQYLRYLENPCSPDGSNNFCEFGINYYTKERAQRILQQITSDTPEDYQQFVAWLDKAATQYNGFFFLGI